MANPSTSSGDLWQKAASALDSKTIQDLNFAKTGARNVVAAALKAAEEKRDAALKRRYRLTRRGKPDIIVRDVMEKIIHYIKRFTAVGDNVVQYDPQHSALPWAAVRFILQAAVNYTEAEQEILNSIELVTRLLASFREIESLYLGPEALPELYDALVSAYIAILETLAYVVKFYSQSKASQLIKAPFRVPDRVDVQNILQKEQNVLRFKGLTDGKWLKVNYERTVELSTNAEKAIQESKYVDVLRWISKTEYRDHHETQSSLRLPGTGTWLLQHPTYKSWQHQSSSSMLLVHGISGCGKTVLCSAVIDESHNSATPANNKAPLAHFYCSATASEPDRRNTLGVLRSLVRQLTATLSRYPMIQSAVLAVYDKRLMEAESLGLSLPQLQKEECESLILEVAQGNPATIIIDAVDELDDTADLLCSLERICAKSNNVVKILITGRDKVAGMTKAQRIRVTLEDNELDVKAFVTHRVERLAKKHCLSTEAKQKVVGSLLAGAGEMFQWAKLQLSQFEATDAVVEQDVDFENSTSTLEKLHGSIFAKIMQSGKVACAMAVQSFSWLLYAQENLTVDAFLSVTANTAGWLSPSPQALIDICRGLVYIDTRSNCVRLVHDSVRSFLISQPLFAPHETAILLSSACMRLLKEVPAVTVTTVRPREELYDYAVLYLGHHLASTDPGLISDSEAATIDEFLFGDAQTGFYAEAWIDAARTSFDSLPYEHAQKASMEAIVSSPCSILFPVCAFNVIGVLKHHAWPKDFDWNQVNLAGHTALYVASFFGHSAVSSFLLDQGADPSIACGRLGTAIQCAAYHGHREIVLALSLRGAGMKTPGKFDSALQAACRGGQEDVALAILENGIAISNQDDYEKCLSEVLSAGFTRAFSLLQSHPLSKPISYDDTRTFIVKGEVHGLRRLMKLRNCNAVISTGSLAMSAIQGHEAMAVFLIEQGVDVDELGQFGTPLRSACIHGHNSVCRALLALGAKVDGNTLYGSALHTAAMRGHLHTVKLLVDHGANVNIQGGHYGTPLQAATYHGHIEIVKFLIDAKASPHIAGLSKDAIHAAVEGGHHNVVQFFRDAGFWSQKNINARFRKLVGVRSVHSIWRTMSPSRCGKNEDKGLEADPFDPAWGTRPYAPTLYDGRAGSQDDLRGRDKPYMIEAAAAHALSTLNLDALVDRKATEALFVGMMERLAYPIVKSFLEAGLHQRLGDPGLRNLLSAVVSLFDEGGDGAQISGHPIRRKKPLLPYSKSLEEVFTSGPGAAVMHLLRHLPQEAAEGAQYELMLQMGAAAGKVDVVELLIERGVNGSAICSHYGTALQAACRYGHTHVVTVLLEAGVDQNIIAGEYHNALHGAIVGGSLQCVNMLLERGADVEMSGMKDTRSTHRSLNFSPLGCAIAEKKAAIAVALIEKGANVNVIHDDLQPLLIEACVWGNVTVAKSLLDAGANVQARGRSGSSGWRPDRYGSALHGAAYSENLELVQLLLDYGFGSNSRSDEAQSQLERIQEDKAVGFSERQEGAESLVEAAAYHPNLDIIKLLLTRSPKDYTAPLASAIKKALRCGHLDVAALVFDHISETIDSGELMELW